MELLESLVIPVSKGHLELLRILLVLAHVLFMGYTAVLYGSTMLSVYYNRIAKKTGDTSFYMLAKEIIDTVTSAPTIWFGLGIAPLIGSILLYTQLLAGMKSPVLALLIISLVFYCAGIAVVYIYKGSVNLSSVLSKLGPLDSGVSELKSNNANNNNTLAMWSFILLTFSALFFFAGVNIASNQEAWGTGILTYIFTGGSLLKMLFFVIFSVIIAAVTFLYMTFVWEGGRKLDSDTLAEFAKNKLSRLAILFTIILPLTLAFNLLTTPKFAVNPMTFIFAAVGGILVVLCGAMLYGMVKENKVERSSNAFWMLVFALIFFVVKEQYAFNISSYDNLLVLASKHEEMEAGKKGHGAAEVKVNPEEIFTTKCSACHKFDVKQPTAPSYNEVAKKYVGKEAEMVAFILNPKPVNTSEYPSGMPNQGLKPAEAKAMAAWILEKTAGK